MDDVKSLLTDCPGNSWQDNWTALWDSTRCPAWTSISLVPPAYSEAVGVVLLESMAAGLPVVVTDNCGYVFHIERARAGTIVPTPFDQRTFNQLLAETLTTGWKPEWKQNGLNDVRCTDLFSLPEIAANLIESVVEKGAHS